MSTTKISSTQSILLYLCELADGLYRISTSLHPGDITHVWFSHSSQSSTYVIHGCPQQAKNLILTYTGEKTFQMLLRPLAIDAFLCEHALHTWCEDIIRPRNRLVLHYVGVGDMSVQAIPDSLY